MQTTISRLVQAPAISVQVQTLGQQQATAAFFALASPNSPELGGRSRPVPVGAVPNGSLAAGPGLGASCPYCSSERYAIRRGRLADLVLRALNRTFNLG